MPHQRITTLMIAIFILTITSGCASQYRKRDDEATKKVKRAAIIAFIDKEPASNKIGISLNSGKSSTELGGSSFYQTGAVPDAVYRDLAVAVKKATGWTIASHEDVTSNPLYADEAKKMMAPVKIFFLPKPGENWFTAKDIMVPKAAENLGREGRTKLLNALNVDAVIVAEVNTSVTGGFSMNGFGSRRPQSKFDMQVYQRDAAEPIWIEGATGPKSEESLGWVGFIDE